MYDPWLEEVRSQLGIIDEIFVKLLAERFSVIKKIAIHKKNEGIPMMQPMQVNKVIERAKLYANNHGLSESFVAEIFGKVIEEACRLEDEIINETNGIKE